MNESARAASIGSLLVCIRSYFREKLPQFVKIMALWVKPLSFLHQLRSERNEM